MQWIRPKSVRQVGDIPLRGRIYIEDYVIRYARGMMTPGRSEESAAVLLGNYYTYNGEKIYQISGIVKIPDFEKRISPEISPDTWDQVYQEIKANFTDLEILGWFYPCAQCTDMMALKLLQIHKLNFLQGDKVLYLYEEAKREERFFRYRGGHLEQQKGYYVYYEKNPEMLRYMEQENSRHIHIVEQEDDRVVRNIRGVMAEKQKIREKKKKKENRMTYGIIGMATLILLMIGAVTMYNQNSFDQVKKQLDTIQTMNQGGQATDYDRTVIETEKSGLANESASGNATTGSAAVSSEAATATQ